ncbi:DUF397 domain-containing protein [Actinacidiphila yeochonensis]|uniref:DUF397 domain-containing protein n=1 Tax=Actinacidiphila yeochonensis TaxID=89050 RepID=UPI00055A8E5B|nr:DUF397 domain-containing protein [Actinacidiphila yeochonensis]
MTKSIRHTAPSELAGALWHKSSYSGAVDNCVEHARLADGRQAVRDTKDRESGALVFDADSWQYFLTAVREGTFDV